MLLKNADPIGKGVWLAAITVLESSLASLSYGWLWGGLFFVFITLGSIKKMRP